MIIRKREKNASILELRKASYFPESSRVWSSHQQQRQTRLHGTTQEVHAQWNGLTGVRDCYFLNTRAQLDVGNEFLEESQKFAEINAHQRRTDLSEVLVHLDAVPISSWKGR